MPNLERYISKYRYEILVFCCLAACMLNVFSGWKSRFSYPNQTLFAAGVILVFAIYFLLYPRKESFSERDIIFLIFAVGFIFRLVYVQSTGYLVRQHDVAGEYGHLDYIKRLYDGKGLPDKDVTKYWQFYQPPVWHAICAVFLKAQRFVGIGFEAALENLQMISLFCSSAIMFISHRLFRLFGMKELPLCIACGIVAFHPTFIILAGSINNDVMSLMLSLLALVLAIKWFRKPKLVNILALALAIGGSMAVKLSGGLIAVGVAILFAIRLFGKKYSKKGNLIAQFASFGAVCVPLALWWEIRNFILFKTPLTFVPMLSEKSDQYIGHRSVFERLFDISSIWEAGVYPSRVTRGYLYYEYNIPTAALKSSVFGEYYLGKESAVLSVAAKVLFFTGALLALLAVVATVYMLIKAIKNRKSFENDYGFSVSELAFPAICAVTMIVSYVSFCFKFAHFCTMDFRYIAITVVLGALYIGLLLKDRQKTNKMCDKVLVWGVGISTALLAFGSIALYGSVA
ncbi:MAG: hypothetical protein IJO64_06155 [Clostridia bacterium]|nr:hypothetical protein [Clostridia bacterium]MBQ9848619.1 hypothetical protein [Clostridia bacterium]